MREEVLPKESSASTVNEKTPVCPVGSAAPLGNVPVQSWGWGSTQANATDTGMPFS